MKRKLRFALSLREEPFFRDLNETLLNRMEGYVFHRDYEPRQIIFFPDDPLDYVYWIREGRVKITRLSSDRRELTYRHLVPGDMFGEECLLNRAKRETYAEAMTTSVICLMRADDFRRIAREDVEIAYRTAQRLLLRVTDLEQTLTETVFQSVQQRIASCLIRLYRQTPKSDNNALRITHQEIASLVGSTRETTTALLHGLRETGVISLGNRRITVLDPAALERLAGAR